MRSQLLVFLIPSKVKASDEKASDNQGVANYVDGKSSGLVYTQSNGKVRIGVDQAEDVALRNAVRMSSKETFNPSQNLLFIIDVHQMPSMCGVWPAIWVCFMICPVRLIFIIAPL